MSDVKASCLGKSSTQCDQLVQEYCAKNENDQNFCGCSTNMLKDKPDPALGMTPVKCWSDKCNKNANAYQFLYADKLTCPQVCVDQSTITALGSNITGSEFNQSSCGGQNVKTEDPKAAQNVTKIYTYGVGVVIAFVVILLCISLSMSLILVIK